MYSVDWHRLRHQAIACRPKPTTMTPSRRIWKESFEIISNRMRKSSKILWTKCNQAISTPAAMDTLFRTFEQWSHVIRRIVLRDVRWLASFTVYKVPFIRQWFGAGVNIGALTSRLISIISLNWPTWNFSRFECKNQMALEHYYWQLYEYSHKYF